MRAPSLGPWPCALVKHITASEAWAYHDHSLWLCQGCGRLRGQGTVGMVDFKALLLPGFTRLLGPCLTAWPKAFPKPLGSWDGDPGRWARTWDGRKGRV